MFNFQEELDRVKKAKSDYYHYMAEEFLKGALKVMIERDMVGLQIEETFDISYKECSEKCVSIAAGANNYPGFVRHYPYKVGIEVFKRIKDIVRESNVRFKEDKNSIHVKI